MAGTMSPLGDRHRRILRALNCGLPIMAVSALVSAGIAEIEKVRRRMFRLPPITTLIWRPAPIVIVPRVVPPAEMAARLRAVTATMPLGLPAWVRAEAAQAYSLAFLEGSVGHEITTDALRPFIRQAWRDEGDLALLSLDAQSRSGERYIDRLADDPERMWT